MKKYQITLFLIYLFKLANFTDLPPYGGPFAKDALLQKESLIVGYFPNHLPTMGVKYPKKQIIGKQTFRASSASDLGISNQHFCQLLRYLAFMLLPPGVLVQPALQSRC